MNNQNNNQNRNTGQRRTPASSDNVRRSPANPSRSTGISTNRSSQAGNVSRTGASSNRSASSVPSHGASHAPAQRSASSAKNQNTARKKSSSSGYNAKKAKPTARRYEENTGNTAITSLLKAVIYIMSILVVSGFLSYFAITVGNDIFAFVKGDEEITVTIDESTDIKQLGKILGKNGVIQYPSMFNLYAKLRDKNPDLVAGEYTVTPSMNYDQLIATFAKTNKTEKTTVVVVIPEGYTVDQIIDTLVNKYKLSSEAELVDAIQNYPFDYWFLDKLEESTLRYGRKYRLEGYLYPDTYYYYSDASAATILYKMLDNFDKKLKQIYGSDYQEEIQALCDKHGMTFDDIVILASMIQMEAKYDVEYGDISSVFHNRLNNPSITNGKLESDATIQYFLEERTPDLTTEQTKIDNPYNTYLYAGLPPGAISNPTYLAINYALYPNETNYYFFVADVDGYSLFASTHKGHEANIATVNAHKKALNS